MPSFDTVSEIDHHELSNAIDQANREIGTRYDFKGSDAKVEQAGNQLTLNAEIGFSDKADDTNSAGKNVKTRNRCELSGVF